MSTPTVTAPPGTAPSPTANSTPRPTRPRVGEGGRDGLDQWFDLAQQILDTQRRMVTAWVDLFRLDR